MPEPNLPTATELNAALRAARRRLLDFAVDAAFGEVVDLTPSRALQASAFKLVTLPRGPRGVLRGAVVFPQFWARYLHDGRGPIQARFGRKLVFFADPRDDPRIAPIPRGYPTEPSQARRLTEGEYRAGLERNRRRRLAGQPPYMVVVDRVGPFEGYHWLDEGGLGRPGMRTRSERLERRVGSVAQTELGILVANRIGGGRREIRVRL